MSKIFTYVEWGQAEGYTDYSITTDGQVFSLKTDKFLLPHLNYKGYLRICLCNDLGEYKYVYVHRLVYMAHKGEIPKGMQINHLDENKTNNCVDNLELVTPKENINYGTGNKRRSETMKKARRFKNYISKQDN